MRLQGFTSLRNLVAQPRRNLASFIGKMHSLAELERLVVDVFPDVGPLQDVMKHLTSLKSLFIGNCREVTFLPEELKYATILQDLNIINLPSLVARPHWIGDISLQSLRTCNCPNLVSLPYDSGLQHLKNLQSLAIEDCMRDGDRCVHVESKSLVADKILTGIANNMISIPHDLHGALAQKRPSILLQKLNLTQLL
ncbi:Leucine-rich repeats and WD repeat domain-containing protein 1 [Asimina triloba]